MSLSVNSNPTTGSPQHSPASRILGSGLMPGLMRAFDWSTTPLGPIARWSETLVCTVNQLLHDPLPVTLSWGPDLTFFYNEAAISTLQAKHPAALGRSYRQVFAEAWKIVGPDLTACLTLAQTPIRENILIPILKDGRMQDQYWTYSLIPIFDQGKLAGVFNPYKNVTETVLATRERGIATAQLNQFLEATTDSVVGVDREWRISYLNRAAMATYASGPVLIGRKLWEEFPTTSYEGSRYVHHYTRAMNEGVPGSFEARDSDLHRIWSQIEVYPTPEGIVIVSRDISERRRAEAALLQSEKLEAVGRMADSMAHEINNPLEAVTNLLYIARHSTDVPNIHSLLDAADEQLRRVSVVANQTLRFHKQSSYPKEITCLDLFSTVLAMFEGKLRNGGLEVKKRKRANRPVRIYEGDIRQVLSNLIGNAIDATPPGGTLFVRSREATNWRSGEKGLTLTIADTGAGMPPHVLARAFEAFFSTKGIGGSGLGLWISKDIVERHHGTLRIRSSQSLHSRGTVVTLFLPFDSAS